MERAVLVYTTWPSIVEAEQGAAALSRQGWRPASTLPGDDFAHWWEGKTDGRTRR